MYIQSKRYKNYLWGVLTHINTNGHEATAILRMVMMTIPMIEMIISCFPDGYTTDDIKYLWKYGNHVSVEVVDDVKLAQYDLISVKTDNNTERTLHGKGGCCLVLDRCLW